MPQQPISNVKALSVLHFSLFVGQIMFAGIAAYFIYSKSFNPPFWEAGIRMGIIAGLAAFSWGLALLAFNLFKKKVEKIRMNGDGVTDKLTAYRAGSIIRWAMLEAPVLLTIVCFLVTGEYYLLIIVAVLLMVFYYTKPSTSKVAQELGISEEEVK
ncbi:MAG: hypothetical protein EOO03_05895 [Chitinophagaceae bacterium]|nr:MAG: hypothetical protein EOO03_05895 [Chitinophagaceae bacterium]